MGLIQGHNGPDTLWDRNTIGLVHIGLGTQSVWKTMGLLHNGTGWDIMEQGDNGLGTQWDSRDVMGPVQSGTQWYRDTMGLVHTS